MRIVCAGGGPAGLYFAISMKRRDPAHAVLVVERNRPDDTFGWGVVLSDQTLDNLAANDPESAAEIRASFAYWDDIEVHFKGARVRSGGHGFCGIGRRRLLQILQARARALGVELAFETEVETLDRYAEADLIVASDGINSKIRTRYADSFAPDIELRANKFIWLGTHRPFDAFTFIFTETPAGWIWAHAYRFDRDTATFIVECQEETWRGLGFAGLDTEGSIARCEALFAPWLDGHALMSNARHLRGAAWLSFPRVSCASWSFGKIVLMGDAAHTAHFSIGSGTKLALEDAIELAALLAEGGALPETLARYEARRRVEVLKLQSAARNSTEWFEAMPRYAGLEPLQFTYALLTRSQRVSHENLRLRDRPWLEQVEGLLAARAGADEPGPVPPMLTPFRLRGLALRNRVVVSPMATYKAVDGLPGDFHLVHYGARAQGGAALVMTEMTHVAAEARITPGCTGLYEAAHAAAWKRIVDFVHGESQAAIGLQLGHAGPKGSTQLGWQEMDAPLAAGNWPLIGPSAVAWSPNNQVPRAMTEADMAAVIGQFERAARWAVDCGFDLLELHCGHGYLLSAFITPLTNRRTDAYGGSLENRLRFPLAVLAALRAIWPAERPMSVRISASDWVGAEGIEGAEAVRIATAFRQAGADIINVSAGQTSIRARPVYGRMFQTPLSDRIRNEAGIATMAVGNITEIDHVNSIIAAGRADLCCLARPHLADPYWTLHAAARQGYAGEAAAWPLPYRAGEQQMRRLLQRAGESGGAI